MQNCGIQDVRTLEQLYDLDIALTSVFDDTFYDNFVEYQESYASEVDDSAIVAIVRTTGNIRPYNYSCCQEVTVEQVILGDKSLENKNLHIYDGPKFMTNDDNNTLEYRSIKNIMQPDHTYLAFFCPAVINEYLKEDVYQFNESFFCYLDLTNNSSVPITESSSDLRNIRDIEFFTSSQRTLDAMLEIKNIIIEKYLD